MKKVLYFMSDEDLNLISLSLEATDKDSPAISAKYYTKEGMVGVKIETSLDALEIQTESKHRLVVSDEITKDEFCLLFNQNNLQ